MSSNGSPRDPAKLRSVRLSLEAFVGNDGIIYSVDIVASDQNAVPILSLKHKHNAVGYSYDEITEASATWCLLLDGNVSPP